ncbi:WecB/TagA/CpsF family glycosyltransferase [Candidatus Thalassolituus haligoni]|uniref:WecB/TagA/CpsF family glycosyltransferase n=1 Tax=Candidatus Thalassolituus haligoni TaxID=3100113 RepID=UPI0035192102
MALIRGLLSNIYIVESSVFVDELKKIINCRISTLAFLNMHAVNICDKDSEFKEALLESDFLLRDGVGIEICMKLYGISPGENLNGTDLIPKILNSLDCEQNVVLLGSKDEVLCEAQKVIDKRFNCNVVGTLNGYEYTFNEYLEFVSKVKPSLIILAMGMPKQEKLAFFLKKNYENENGSLIISGGAILSFITGYEKRAPVFVRKLRCEWIWRLAMDPFRLWKRFVVGGMKFFLLMVIPLLKNK